MEKFYVGGGGVAKVLIQISNNALGMAGELRYYTNNALGIYVFFNILSFFIILIFFLYISIKSNKNIYSLYCRGHSPPHPLQLLLIDILPFTN